MAPTRSRPSRPTRTKTVPVDGGTVAYDALGDGPEVLFLHSVIADRRMWDRQFSGFSDRHRVIRFDLRGFGGSSAATAPFSCTDDIDALLDHLEVSSAYLVGSSMGGAMAVDYALARPERVRGLFLAAPGLSGGFPPPFDADETAAFDYDEKKSQELSAAWAGKDSARAFELLRQLWCSALEGDSLALFRRMVEENAAEVFDNRSLKFARDPPPASPRLPSVRVPTTVLYGDRDNPSSVPFAKRIARGIPGSRLEVLPGADHLINLSRPEPFDLALRAALGELG